MNGPVYATHAERRQAGLDQYREVMLVEHPTPTTPRQAALVDFVFAEIWTRPGLTRRERRIITLTCAAGSDAHETFADHVGAALRSGDLTDAELGELILHFAVYCGWGKAETAERIIERVATTQRAEQPLSSVPEDLELRLRGGEQEFLDVNVTPAPPRGIPYFETGILNFVFGEMWKRPGLSRRDRRWITLSCVGLDDTTTPIQSHVTSALATGDVTVEELREFVLHFAAYCGWPKGSFMQQVVEEANQRLTAGPA